MVTVAICHQFCLIIATCVIVPESAARVVECGGESFILVTYPLPLVIFMGPEFVGKRFAYLDHHHRFQIDGSVSLCASSSLYHRFFDTPLLGSMDELSEVHFVFAGLHWRF
ncbi:hypothetical protein LINGRAHAP2_LOCUS23831 [Linum grandiflorum]